MAISFVGSAEASNNNGANLSVTLPAMVQNDDCWIISAAIHAGIALGMNTAGYTPLFDGQNSAGTCRIEINRKIMGASPDSTAVVNGVGAGANHVAIAYVLRGQDATTPEDANETSATGSSTNPNPPSITVVTANAWQITAFASAVSDAAVTAPTSFTNQIDRTENGSGGQAITVGVASILRASAGAVDAPAWSGVSNGSWIAVNGLVRPSAAAVGTGLLTSLKLRRLRLAKSSLILPFPLFRVPMPTLERFA